MIYRGPFQNADVPEHRMLVVWLRLNLGVTLHHVDLKKRVEWREEGDFEVDRLVATNCFA